MSAETQTLGRTDLQVSRLCLGTMQFGWSADAATSFAIMDAAVDAGCNFFDTAELYSAWAPGNDGGESEALIGRWLTRRPEMREKVVVATKIRGSWDDDSGEKGLTRRHIMKMAEESLRRLQLERIDLYQVHWPSEETPVEETLRALDELVRSGKVRNIGCSNHPPVQLRDALQTSAELDLVRYESLQPHYSYVHRQEFEEALEEICLERELGVIPYSPLAKGFLTGKYRRGASLPDSERADSVRRNYMNERGFAAVEALEEVARKKGATIPQVAIAWVLANPAVTAVISGANSVDQLLDTIAGTRLPLTDAEKSRLDAVTAWR